MKGNFKVFFIIVLKMFNLHILIVIFPQEMFATIDVESDGEVYLEDVHKHLNGLNSYSDQNIEVRRHDSSLRI